MTISRREFLKQTTAGVGIVGSGSATAFPGMSTASLSRLSTQSRRTADVIVVGAGAFGMWTALHLVRLGVRVTVVDAYGPGNSRQTSGGETRGVRTSYGDRPHGRLWTRWAGESIQRWRRWDEEVADRGHTKMFFATGDLIMRESMTPYLEETRGHWDAVGTPYETLAPDEVAYRWPWIRFDGLGAALYEAGAGVVRARRAIQSVAQVFQEEKGTIRTGRAFLASRRHGRLESITVGGGELLSAATTIFACGPWFPKMFPQLMGKRLRIPIGHVFYFGVPPEDRRFSYPHMPSYGLPGCTGWPALPPDHRGFRVRTGGRAAEDPDSSDRWIPSEFHDRPRGLLSRHFPALAEAPISETRACHYELSIDRNFIVDTHPDFDNVWIVGGGSSEGFKFGPVLGEYIARRVLGLDNDPVLAAGFALKDEQFEA